MNHEKFYEIKGYFKLLSTIFSQVHPPITGVFDFELIHDKKDLNDGFKNFIKHIWNEFGRPKVYVEFDLDSYNFNFENCTNWELDLADNLGFWISHITKTYKDDYSKKEHLKYIQMEILNLLKEFIGKSSIECYKLKVEEHEDFLKHNLSYLRNDCYFIVSENQIYLIHFGLDD